MFEIDLIGMKLFIFLMIKKEELQKSNNKNEQI
jgi:hypothetical protein